VSSVWLAGLRANVVVVARRCCLLVVAVAFSVDKMFTLYLFVSLCFSSSNKITANLLPPF
jgi:hypothetical protein